jgi:hypothetical protein
MFHKKLNLKSFKAKITKSHKPTQSERRTCVPTDRHTGPSTSLPRRSNAPERTEAPLHPPTSHTPTLTLHHPPTGYHSSARLAARPSSLVWQPPEIRDPDAATNTVLLHHLESSSPRHATAFPSSVLKEALTSSMNMAGLRRLVPTLYHWIQVLPRCPLLWEPRASTQTFLSIQSLLRRLQGRSGLDPGKRRWPSCPVVHVGAAVSVPEGNMPERQ